MGEGTSDHGTGARAPSSTCQRMQREYREISTSAAI